MLSENKSLAALMQQLQHGNEQSFVGWQLNAKQNTYLPTILLICANYTHATIKTIPDIEDLANNQLEANVLA